MRLHGGRHSPSLREALAQIAVRAMAPFRSHAESCESRPYIAQATINCHVFFKHTRLKWERQRGGDWRRSGWLCNVYVAYVICVSSCNCECLNERGRDKFLLQTYYGSQLLHGRRRHWIRSIGPFFVSIQPMGHIKFIYCVEWHA